MSRRKNLKAMLAGGSCALALATAGMATAQTRDYDVPAGDLMAALDAYARQSGVQIIYRITDVSGVRSGGAQGALSADEALNQLLAGTNFEVRRDPSGAIALAQAGEGGSGPQSGSAGSGAEVEALIVTAQKREEDIQDVPIAISAFSQEDLENHQIAGGPDLITQIPNFSFTKTNFTSYSIQIRGIGTQAISATTDPAVAVAFNNTPFIRNRFFEQEFYDLERLEVLRGPQGTLYGRNATAGVVNIISGKPKFTYEAKLSGDVANYNSMRVEGMINIPLVEDAVALRLAGAWTKREGYAFNQMTGQQIDGRDLWSVRASLRFEPTDWLRANFIYEHFQEDDDRLRSGKQLCKKHVITEVGGIPVTPSGGAFGTNTYLSQGCTAVSLYSEEAFQTPNGFALPYYGPLSNIGNPVFGGKDPYVSSNQSRDLRVIESSVEPDYRANTDLAELQVAIDLSDTLTLNSETSYNTDSLFSLQDYNRFTTATSAFQPGVGPIDANGFFCDPQLGCSDRLLLVDLSTSDSSQFSQEFRLGSDFDGSFNFSLGANFLRHDVEDKYYVFINSLSLWALHAQVTAATYVPGVTDNSSCQELGRGSSGDTAPYYDPNLMYGISINTCTYTDPNPIGALNDQGRNYFLSRNPYKLISYAAFGEVYYNITDDLKLTGGLRFTVDKKTAPQVPSWLLADRTTGSYPTATTVYQEWNEPTGRLAIDWKPDFSFTDETLVYASYAHGYKAGGANPPPPVLVTYGVGSNTPPENLPNEVIPETFGPEFIDAFEVGTKNTLFGGALILNLTGFYYDYKGYQTSEIRNRAAVNSNFDAEVWGLEVEADWRPIEALRLGFKGGWQETRMADGSSAVDLLDRTAGHDDWFVVRPFPSVPSNCIVPLYVLTAGGLIHAGLNSTFSGMCIDAYYLNYDPITSHAYEPNPTLKSSYATDFQLNIIETRTPLGPEYADYPGFDPSTAPNGGMGFSKDLSGNELPNAPNYTATVTVDYTVPLPNDWLATVHGDYHYQSESWARVINSDPYDRIKAFSTVNVAAIFTNEDAGWKVMAYVKNVFDETAITGSFLNSDDTGLTTNVFLTEPRLYGVRVTKDWNGGGWLGELSRRTPGEPYPFTIEIGGGVSNYSGDSGLYQPDWLDGYSPTFAFPLSVQDDDLDIGDTRSVKLAYAPSKDWRISAAYRFGKTNSHTSWGAAYEHVPGGYTEKYSPFCTDTGGFCYVGSPDNHGISGARGTEEHALVDFMIGREFGLGTLGDSKSMLSVGLRYADFRSTSTVSMDGTLGRYIEPSIPPSGDTSHFSAYTSSLYSDRGFEGTGPSVTWEASTHLFGSNESGWADLEWSVGAGVLFGKQTMDSSEERFGRYYFGGFRAGGTTRTTLYDDVVPRYRTEDTTVPNVSLSLGLSYNIDRVKVSTGYSYDRFFDVIDGGYKDAQSFDRTFHGPFLKLAIGFGG